MFQQYRTNKCKQCWVREKCTTSTRNGKIVQHRKHAHYITANRKRIQKNPGIYKRRQVIVEHPYGTIKRQWGYSYIITKKGIQRASADVGFMFTACNLCRIINILGQERLKEYLKLLISCVSSLTWLYRIKISCLIAQKSHHKSPQTLLLDCINALYLS
jgi:hypothetical protein